MLMEAMANLSIADSARTYTCTVYNEFSSNSTYVVNIQGIHNVNTFIERMKQNPYHSHVTVQMP